MRRFLGLLALLGVALLMAEMLRLGVRPHASAVYSDAGTQACAGCHAAEVAAWRQSHHAVAMQTDPAQFLGAFGQGGRVTWGHDAAGLTATLDGRTVPVHAALGVYPLQQYLADMPDGRKQVLPVAWDARPAAQGGQRWFNPAHDGSADWTDRDATWNFMCVDCHSTGVSRGYDLATNTYRTRFEEPSVGCAACHGPGAAHVAWARAGADPASGPALSVRPGGGAGAWGPFDAASGIRHWVGPARGDAALDVCAPCHARRRRIVDRPAVGAPFLDGYEPSLLTADLYQADGQIKDEVFEYGSFLQSRMFANGVACADCHDPHSGKPRLAGNALCGQCHDAARFDTVSHKHHAPGSQGSRCIACHMPTRTYMGVHVRHDHGLLVPDPGLSAMHGTSDACTACHADRSQQWAADAITGWRGGGVKMRSGAAVALAAGHEDAQAAAELFGNRSLPGIVRASLLGDAAAGGEAIAAAGDADPLVRLAAAYLVPADAQDVLRHLAIDPVRAVRIAAARRIPQDAAASGALAEWRAAEAASADRPESHLNLGALLADEGSGTDAEAEWRTARRLDPGFTPALVDLADLRRVQGREAEAEAFLRQAVEAAPGDAAAWYALGLAMIRQRRLEEAEQYVRRAAKLSPGDATYMALLRQFPGSN